MRLGARIVGAVLACLIAGTARAQADFSVAPWLADLDQIRDSMTASYPNLEWAAAHEVDLPKTYARAQTRLGAAHDAFEARSALDRFVQAFGDGHLELRWAAAKARPGPSPAPKPLCERLGYFQLTDEAAIATRLPGLESVGAPDSHFKAGVANVGRARIGVLRVPIFEPQGFPDLCAGLVAQLDLRPESPCDDACEERFSRAADAAFVGELKSQVQALTAARPDTILVDLAGNGGGNDSAIVLARMLAGKPLKTPRVGFVRTGAWAASLAERQADIRKALALNPGAARAELQRFAASLATAQLEAAKTCDRAPLWRGEPIACSQVVTEPLFAGGLSPDAPTQGQAGPARETISATARFPNVTAIWRGPLMVLVDGGSASSSELFAAMLQDAHAATLLGAPTFGAGCGHLTDAPPVMLRNSGGVLSMPDCLRLRADGDNELNGIEPDVLIGFRRHDTPHQRVELLARALPSALSAARLAH